LGLAEAVVLGLCLLGFTSGPGCFFIICFMAASKPAEVISCLGTGLG
jgi:hypothetical protein